MRIVVNEQLKDAIEWTCKYASEYKVDIDIHIDADGEISVSVCPTYRDTADTPQTDEIGDCNSCEYLGDLRCGMCTNGSGYRRRADTPQTKETCERCVYVRGSQWCQGCNGTPKRWDGEKIVDTPQTDCGWGKPTTVSHREDKED